MRRWGFEGIFLYGYAGRILKVNLSRKTYRTEPLSEEFARKYVGGAGFGIKMLLDEQPPGIDPFDPENPLIFTVGPLAGTMAPTSGKYAAFAKSPESNFLGEGYSTGFFGPELKRAGYKITRTKNIPEVPDQIVSPCGMDMVTPIDYSK